jgi:hypothetical protein
VLLDALDMVSVSLLNSHRGSLNIDGGVLDIVRMLEIVIKSKYNNAV